jgi:hypothetical protein
MGVSMRYTKFTVAVAAAGAGVICLAPAAAAEETAPEPSTATAPGAVGLEPCFRVRGIIPCVRVGSVRGIIPCVRVRSERGIIPCVRVGVPVVPEGRIVDINPPDPVHNGDGSAPVS